MTLAITTNRNDYIGNGSASTFSFTFLAFATADLAVYVTDSNYNQTLLALTQDYTVSGLPPSGALQAGTAPSAGSITLVNNSQAWLNAGNLATGYTLSIVRVLALTQATSIRNQGAFFPEIHENEFDDIVMMLQQIGTPAVVLPPGMNPSNFSPVLPTNMPANPNAAIIINPTGTGFTVGVANPSLIAVPVSIAQGGTGSSAVLVGNRILKSQLSPQKIIEAALITANRALTSDANGIPVASAVTDTQLGYLINLFSYRRPVLQYSSATVVNMETGINGTSGQLTILFSTGQLVTDSTGNHFNIDLSRVASSSQSGLRTGTVAANTWYACYATLNGSNIIGVADTVLPIQANYATLNSNFGTGAWVYIGLIRYGDNSAATTAIIKFVQAGAITIFRNSCTNGSSGTNGMGILLANATSAASVTYTYAAGTGTTQVPNNISMVKAQTNANVGSTGTGTMTSAGNEITGYSAASMLLNSWVGMSENIAVLAPASSNLNIYLAGFIDGALGIGFNPLL